MMVEGKGWVGDDVSDGEHVFDSAGYLPGVGRDLGLANAVCALNVHLLHATTISLCFMPSATTFMSDAAASQRSRGTSAAHT